MVAGGCSGYPCCRFYLPSPYFPLLVIKGCLGSEWACYIKGCSVNQVCFLPFLFSLLQEWSRIRLKFWLGFKRGCFVGLFHSQYFSVTCRAFCLWRRSRTSECAQTKSCFTHLKLFQIPRCWLPRCTRYTTSLPSTQTHEVTQFKFLCLRLPAVLVSMTSNIKHTGLIDD